MTESPRRLRTREAADYLGLAPSTLEKYRITGEGPPFERAGVKIIVYRVDALEAWVSARSYRSTSDYQPKGD